MMKYMLNEADQRKSLLEIWEIIKANFKNASQVKKWYVLSKNKINDVLSSGNLPPKCKKLVANASRMLQYAIDKDEQNLQEGIGSFIMKNFFKILVCIYVLVLFVPGAMVGLQFGLVSPHPMLHSILGFITGV